MAVAAVNVIKNLERLLSLSLVTAHVSGAVLPEDRTDVLYHLYDGGGAEIDGPSLLVRKNIADKVSIYGNYYVDMVSSASIDVLATASPYSEERTEQSVGIDYLRDKTIMSLSYTNSEESDYSADTVSFDISQDFFGDLSTLSLGFSFGDDTVRQNGDSTFEDTAEHRRYRINLTQVITKNMIASIGVESLIDEGYLNNPYRSVRFADSSAGSGFSYERELYPRTRNADAIGIKAMYYLPYRASLRGEFRYFSDSWGITANNIEMRYIHPVTQIDGLILEAKLRRYNQTSADFYNDLFDFRAATNFRARDKELSSYSSIGFGVGGSYEIRSKLLSWFDKTTVNLYWDHMRFSYDNFRDVTATGYAAGEEPLYEFDANVFRLYFSFWY